MKKHKHIWQFIMPLSDQIEGSELKATYMVTLLLNKSLKSAIACIHCGEVRLVTSFGNKKKISEESATDILNRCNKIKEEFRLTN